VSNEVDIASLNHTAFSEEDNEVDIAFLKIDILDDYTSLKDVHKAPSLNNDDMMMMVVRFQN